MLIFNCVPVLTTSAAVLLSFLTRIRTVSYAATPDVDYMIDQVWIIKTELVICYKCI
jgi:hypothetical protein